MAKPSLIVGVGASAGGLDSLERFFSTVPADCGLAFVVVQHLSPDYKSLMHELLARRTNLPIVTAEDGMEVQADHIYLMPPKKEMIISEGLLLLTDKYPVGGLTLPIDHFFRSLANDVGNMSVAVVLSGTGSDGSRGIRDVFLNDGLVLVEDDDSAAFNGMPLAARETGMVHWVLPASEMIVKLLERKAILFVAPESGVVVHPDRLHGIEGVFSLLKQEYDIDFSGYKPAMVRRRIERRWSLAHVDDIDQYLVKLRTDENELNSLYRDLLIGVTQFFRDHETFDQLERRVIPQIIQNVPAGEEIRIWVAGCATGEEAYSLAILFDEVMKQLGRDIPLKIFATDVHKASLDFAAQGCYTKESLGRITETRLRNYFISDDRIFRVIPQMRQSIVFAKHNLLKDAPFTKLDLVSCRNLLIYFQSAAQRKAIAHFHFGLKTGSTLLLGSSESLGEMADEFEIIDEHCKLFTKRRSTQLLSHLRSPSFSSGSRIASTKLQQNVIRTDMHPVYDRLLEKFMPPALLVNQNRELIECYSGAEKYLRVKGRKLSHDILDLLDSDAKTAIAGSLARVIHHGQPISFTGIKLSSLEGEVFCRLEIECISDQRASDRLYLIVLHPLQAAAEAPKSIEIDVGEASQDMVASLQRELSTSKENLQATIEELQTSNEEMQATNEELIASNEELQSTNEELHSVNEELYSVNAELQKKVRELAELNFDMENLFESTDVATIFFDDNLSIRRFTPDVTRLVDLVEADIGRRFHTFTYRIQHKTLLSDLESVLAGGAPIEREVQGQVGDYYFMRILPYRVGKTRAGVVLSFIDISTLVRTRERLLHLSEIVQSSEDAIASMNLDGAVLSWNKGAESLYGYTAEEAIGKKLSQVVCITDQPHSAGLTAVDWLDKFSGGAKEVQATRKDHRRVHVTLSCSKICDAEGRLVAAAAISRDTTERRRLAEMFRRTFESAPAGMLMFAQDGSLMMANDNAQKLFGYSAEELKTLRVEALIPLRYRESHEQYRTDYARHPQSKTMGLGRDLYARRKDGSEFPVEVGLSPVNVDAETLILAAVADITSRREATEALREEVRLRERFLAMLSHELRNPLGAMRNAAHLLAVNKKAAASNDAVVIINRQTDHMSRLLDDLLDVARITQDRILLVTALVDLQAIIRNAVDAVEQLAKESGVKLKKMLGKSALMVTADQTRIEQVITNLLTNAIKYSNPNTLVTIRLWKEGKLVKLSIKDQGVGIAEDVLPKVFDLFMQADATLDRSRGGMGVGLTLAKKLVELHGGAIEAKSAGVGEGSEFIVALPAAKAIATASTNPTPIALTTKPLRRVLIVEDQPDNRQMLKALFELKGLEVQDASNGDEALALIAKQHFDIAIVDIGLPGINGYQVAQRIRTNYGNGLILVALTGYGRQSDIQDALESGFNFHLVKPIVPDRLFAMLSL